MHKDKAFMLAAALRSGDFKQGRARLRGRVEDDYCCLGVLSELAAREGVVTSRCMVDSWAYGESSAFLPLAVQLWAGMKTNYGRFGDGANDTLLDMNDCGEYTFDEIADVIEREWQNL